MVSTATPSSFSMPEKRPPKKTSSGSSDEAAVQSAVQNSLSAETDTGLGSSPVKRTVMKFGGSSLADADRIRFVADIVASQRRTVGVDPMVVCSAMGSSTNQLLAAGDFALDGKLYTDAIRKLHIATCDDLGVDDNTRADVEVGEKETGPCVY
jgi:predicted DNA binding protein